MKNIYLVRHGETIWNCQSKTQGCKNIRLNENGILQGEMIAKKLKSLNNNYVKIYTSDLDRCYETAKIISQNINQEIKALDSIREMNFGRWEGLTLEEIKKDYFNEYTSWRTTPHETLIPEGESLKIVQDRCLSTINNICSSFKIGSVIIVSHSIAIKTIILGLLNIDLSHFYKFSQSNGCINKIEIRDYGPVLTKLNDTSHLENL